MQDFPHRCDVLRLPTSLLANVEDQKDICGCACSPGLEKKQTKKKQTTKGEAADAST